MHFATNTDVLRLRVNRARDPDGRFTKAALDAERGLENAIRGRRLWTGVLAVLGAPATLMLAYPALLASELRMACLFFWPLAALGLVVNVVAVKRYDRRLRSVEAQLRAVPPRRARG
jgi:hypothetical protein